MRRKGQSNKRKTISFESKIRVRFNETDPLGIVWHGNYITYFEDGREAFGHEHGVSYLDAKRNGFVTPIIKSSCEHKLPLSYGDIATIKTTFVDSLAAKIIFEYIIYNADGKTVCTGQTVQVFLDDNGELFLTIPPFFADWKRKIGFIK